MGAEVRMVPVLLGRHIGFEDRCKHRHRRRHDRPIDNAGDAEWAHLAPGLRYPYTPNCLHAIRLPAESLRQFAKPPLFAIRPNVRKVLPVHPRRATIGLAAPVGILQHVPAMQLVVKQIEPMAGRSLRFGL